MSVLAHQSYSQISVLVLVPVLVPILVSSSKVSVVYNEDISVASEFVYIHVVIVIA